SGFGVQVGLLENYDNVFKFIADLQEDFFKNILLSVEEGPVGSQYRIILGPFPTKDQAQSYRNSLAKKKKLNGFVISLENLSKTGK
ncbi:MAG TPA: SPOR domain-containing protein, partial [Saprospiraceae bacterium]|nr:SPOR domain-containing protein [Saprospiraceae bacterium]